MLGTTVPRPSKKLGVRTVCSAGYSAEMKQFVRIYPLATRDAPKRWSVNRVPLERSSSDTRRESWKLKSRRTTSDHHRVNELFTKVGTTKKEKMLDVFNNPDLVVESTEEAWERGLSLAVMHPKEVEFRLEPNREPTADFPFVWKPYIRVPTDTTKQGYNNLQLLDWGSYMWMSRAPGREDQIPENLRLESGVSSLFIGNQKAHRKNYLVISVLNGIRK